MRTALVLAALLLSLIAGEAALRWLDLPVFDACDTTADYAIPDPKLGFRGAPGGLVAGVRLNARGWRGPLPSPEKSPDERRILFIGDSTCFGLGVELDESFAARATRRLGDDGAHFVLGAFPGYSSYQSASVLDELLPLQPDLVVFYVGARNDGSRARYFADADIPARRARRGHAWHQVRLLRLVEAAIDRSYRSLFRKLLAREDRARVPPAAFRANLTRMLELVRSWDIPALIVIPPLSAAFDTDEPQMRVYREILRQVADENGVPFVAVDDPFAQHDTEALYFDDQFHLAAPGHAIVGDAIFEAIDREGLLSRPREPTFR